MQVTARVLPAGASWIAVDEARAAALTAFRQPSTPVIGRRTRLVRTRAELQAQGPRRALVIRLDYPHN